MDVLSGLFFLEGFDFVGDGFGFLGVGIVLFSESFEHGGFDFKLFDEF